MSSWTVFWSFLKMLYQIFRFSATLVSLLFNIFWFFCNLASAGIPWLTLILVVICVASKFVKLNSPDEKKLMRFLGARCLLGSPDDLTYWPIANKGAGYDAPENSKAALRKCAARGYRNVLLDAGITSNGKIVVANRMTLERSGLTGPVSAHKLEDLEKVILTEQHPLGSQYEAESILKLTDLMEFLDETTLNVFLHISDNSTLMLESLKLFIKEHEQFTRHVIVVTHSPYIIYHLRKQYPELICGLWTEKSLSLAILKASTLITSIYGALFRNIIAPVIGISVVFINKEEFNLHIADLWKNVGVHPIVYTVNSPNEKRYFQKTMKTQYLTDSLRSEPHLLMKA